MSEYYPDYEEDEVTPDQLLEEDEDQREREAREEEAA